MKARLLVSPVALLLLSLAPACANDTAIWGVGGAIRPMQEHPSIAMEKMDLRIHIYRETGRAECHYVFHNTGSATTVRMGFPETVGPVRKGRRIGFLRFSTTVDGRPVPARIEGGLVEGPVHTSRWRVKTVRFEAGQRRRVGVSYTSALGITLGTGGAPVWMPPGGASGSPYSTLFGCQMIPIEQAQALGTEGDIIFANLNQYAICDKGGIQTASSIHVNFTADETVFRFIYRVDGQPLWKSPLTPYRGAAANTLSPFVTLAVRV